MLACIVLTACFCFATSVWFGSFENLILSGFARDWCRFPSRRLPYASICLRSMFAFILAPNDSNIDSRALSLLILDILDQALFHQLKVRCSAKAIFLHIAQLLCYCEKDNLCSSSIQGGRTP